MRAVRLVVTAMIALALLSGQVVVAQGQSDGSTDYSGTVDGGGTIQFTVAPKGDRLTSLRIVGLAGEGCSWDPVELGNWGGNIAVQSNAFSATNNDGDAIRGQFPAAFSAEGTVQVRDPSSGCTSGSKAWTAKAPMPVQAAPPSLGSVLDDQGPAAGAARPGAAAPGPITVGARPAIGPSTDNAIRSAEVCNVGQGPSFHPSLAGLKAQIGDTMGNPLECEHLNNANGDTLQQTSTGLAYFRWATGLPTYTDGWRHWGLTGNGIVQWEGEPPDPPGRP